MPYNSYRKCKICGIDYPYCKTVVKAGVFRYQDVACCPEHGSAYLAKVEESRRSVENKKPSGITAKTFYVNEDEDYDILFEEDFDDEIDEIEIEV